MGFLRAKTSLKHLSCMVVFVCQYASAYEPPQYLSVPNLLVRHKLCLCHGWFIQWIKQLLEGSLKIWTLFCHEYSVVWLIGIRSEVLPGWVMLRFGKDYGFGLPVSLHLLIKFKVILGGCSLFCVDWIKQHNGDTAKTHDTYSVPG